MDIKSDIRNELFKRNEIEAEIEAEKNPSFDEVRKMISESTKKPEEAIDAYGVKGSFGINKFTINAYVYDSKEDLEKAKQLTQKQRKAEVEEAAKAAEEAAKPAEEAPAEEAPAEEAAKPAEDGGEASSEDKPEEEAKAVEEEKQAAEESKE